MRRSAAALVVLGLLLAGCSSDLDLGDFGYLVKVTVRSGGGSGYGRVESLSSPPDVDCEITPSTVTPCATDFVDAGEGGAFSLRAVPSEGSVFVAWGGSCPVPEDPRCDLSFSEGSDVFFYVSARFDLDSTDPCFEVRSAVPSSSAGTGPATPSDPSPAYGAEALINASFEQDITIGSVGQVLPSAYGYWQGDLNSRVASQQGIDPDDGDSMVQFIATGFAAGATGTAEVIQLVKVSHFGQDATDGRVRATIRARFNRVAGCEETDANMLMVVAAMEGPPSEAQARWSVGSAANSDDAVAGGWLKRYRAALVSNADPGDWEELVLVADLPAGTDYIVVDLGASENVVNDEVFPELHGHYVDAASVVFTQLPPP